GHLGVVPASVDSRPSNLQSAFFCEVCEVSRARQGKEVGCVGVALPLSVFALASAVAASDDEGGHPIARVPDPFRLATLFVQASVEHEAEGFTVVVHGPPVSTF